MANKACLIGDYVITTFHHYAYESKEICCRILDIESYYSYPSKVYRLNFVGFIDKADNININVHTIVRTRFYNRSDFKVVRESNKRLWKKIKPCIDYEKQLKIEAKIKYLEEKFKNRNANVLF